jgi:hypothetical protein
MTWPVCCRRLSLDLNELVELVGRIYNVGRIFTSNTACDGEN